ncbi:hypothetical protein [Nonomuraea sediminis]|uniref:hypothetical protein n=1 Tax=Nonomuraea sediminis TaxID=2835864 RepID=UPI001BDBD1EE|nr:hypothetical protein [Nonomuraea sediminis]
MNPGSDIEPPTNPYRVPGGRFEPPTMPPMPPAPPRRRRPWVLPLVAVVVVVLLAGGAGAYLLYGKAALRKQAQPSQAKQTAQAAGQLSAPGPDVCAMLPQTEADRLVPRATVAKDSRDAEYAISFHCNWQNQRISFGEFWRSREIDVTIAQHKGDGAKTGRTMAQNSYEVDYSQGKYVETAKPTPEKGEKEYVSPVKDVQGVGDAAFAQYTWRRSGKLLWYSFGTAQARVGDLTIEVKFQAGQQRKDAQLLSNQSTQSINEANAIREVTALAGYFAKGAAAWKAAHPDALAQPDKAVTSTPTATPEATPTPLSAFPPACQTAAKTAEGLVPGATTRARGLEEGADTQTECRWLNLDLPSGDRKRIRSVLVTVHQFANRAGDADEGAAKGFYTEKQGGAANMGGSSIGGVTWGRAVTLKDLGDQAFSQYVAYKKGAVFNGTTSVTVRKAALVIQVDFAGAEGPKDQPANSPKIELLPQKDADAGALTMTKAMLDAFLKKSVGS